MGKFSISLSTTVAQLKEAFNGLFGSVLRIYVGNKQAEESSTLVSLGVKTGEIDAAPNLTVGDFINACQEGNALKCKVYTKDEWVAVLPDIVLGQTGNIPKGATKAKMEPFIGKTADMANDETESASKSVRNPEPAQKPIDIPADADKVSQKTTPALQQPAKKSVVGDEELTEEEMKQLDELQKQVAALAAEVKSLKAEMARLKDSASISRATIAQAQPAKPIDENNLDFDAAIAEEEYEYAYDMYVFLAKKQIAAGSKSPYFKHKYGPNNSKEDYMHIIVTEYMKPVFKGFIRSGNYSVSDIKAKYRKIEDYPWANKLFLPVVDYLVEEFDENECLKFCSINKSGATPTLFKRFHSSQFKAVNDSGNYQKVKEFVNGLTQLDVEMVWRLVRDDVYASCFKAKEGEVFKSKDVQKINSFLQELRQEGFNNNGIWGLLINQAILLDLESVAGMLLSEYYADDKAAVARRVYAKFPNLKGKK